MWVNLHHLPAHLAQFTALVGDGDDFDEVDFTAPRNASLDALLLAAVDACDDAYDGFTVAGIANQSDGYVLFQ